MNHIPHAQPTARFDIYHRIHKALRACMADTLLWVGRLDCADPHDVGAAMAQVRSIAAFCASHLDHEDDFVHPALEAQQPGAAQHTEHEHGHHAATCAHLAALADAVEAAHGAQVPVAARQLYRALALFLADSIVHMEMEETDNNAVLWAGHSDEQLIAIEHAIVASLTDQERAVTLRWMMPAMTPTERLALLEGVRSQAPAPVFAGILAGVQALLAGNDWVKLCNGLGRTQRLAA